MPTYAELTNALDQAWRTHDYGFALSCIPEVLKRYRGSKSQLWLVRGLVASPRYWSLAAAFEADEVLKTMDRVAKRLWATADGRWKGAGPEELAEERRQTLLAMQWLRRTVEQAGSMELTTLRMLAERERITKVKSRLNWMEKAGTVHLVDGVVHAGSAPEPHFMPMGNAVNGVPLFEAQNPSVWDMDTFQLSFFKDFQARHLAGEHVELEGQWSYAFALIGELEVDYDGDPVVLREAYERFRSEYPDFPAQREIVEDYSDSYFRRGDWQGGYDLLSPELPMDIYLTLAPVVADTHLKVATVENWTTKGRKMTASFRDRKAEVDAALQDLLDAAHDALGRSIVVDLWHRLIIDRVPGAGGPDIADEFGRFITQEKIDKYLAHHDRHVSRSLADLLVGLGMEPIELPERDTSEDIQWPAPYCDTYWFEEIVRARIQSLYRDAENIVRRGAGMPSVGEGWVSEVVLFRAVREEFPERRVLHQGRPSWLGQQSLDIYFPDQNVGIEYQGAQHSGPVNLFGGPLAFERQLERDARKRSLCAANGCQLIEVHPGYDLAAVLAEIREAVDGSDSLKTH
ncbi:hypothetical protein [Salinibacterium sp. ZJ450]|uniref:hypothetical protein n=1 Tax=Salinibacterium sp. ZJ450 TaxID=2708338 RepID=UPI0014225518|nr:hypothetical protein [Salinibacterium sp. ZJ450]